MRRNGVLLTASHGRSCSRGIRSIDCLKAARAFLLSPRTTGGLPRQQAWLVLPATLEFCGFVDCSSAAIPPALYPVAPSPGKLRGRKQASAGGGCLAAEIGSDECAAAVDEHGLAMVHQSLDHGGGQRVVSGHAPRGRLAALKEAKAGGDECAVSSSIAGRLLLVCRKRKRGSRRLPGRPAARIQTDGTAVPDRGVSNFVAFPNHSQHRTCKSFVPAGVTKSQDDHFNSSPHVRTHAIIRGMTRYRGSF